jgi:hypothetical protein
MPGSELCRVIASSVPESHFGSIVKGPAVEPHGERDAHCVVGDVLPNSSAIHDERLLAMRSRQRMGQFDVAGVTLLKG